MKVRIKDNDLKCPGIQLGQTIIYHGTQWIDVEEKYQSQAEKDTRLEIFKDKVVCIKEDKQDVENSQEIKQEINDDVKIEDNKTVDDNDSKIIEDNQHIIKNILTEHWTKAKKKIIELDNIEFLQNDLLPELEKANKSTLVESCKNRIQELNNSLNNN